MKRLGSAISFLLCFCSLSAMAEEPRSLALSAGVFNFSKSESSIEAGIEYRFPLNKWGLAANLGLFGTEDSSFWGFLGLRRDFSLGGRWLITPGFAVALYEEGDGKDLGGPVEFRTHLELGHEFSNRQRLALAIYHLSNAGIYDLNPGSNSAILTYSFPF